MRRYREETDLSRQMPMPKEVKRDAKKRAHRALKVSEEGNRSSKTSTEM